MGAAAGNRALIANVLRISIKYNNFDLLEDGYGLNLRALAVFAAETYGDDECELYSPCVFDDNIYDPVDEKLAARMHKAVTVIQLKLESQLISAHPEWNMNDRNMLPKIDFQSSAPEIELNGKRYPLLDKYFPTIDSENPFELSQSEKELMTILENSFLHSEKLQKHACFLLSKGSMYKICNGNLMFHGCIPMDENGKLQYLEIRGKKFCGKELLDELNTLVNRAFFSKDSYSRDFMWYLWCGAKSPLYGKDKLSFFEHYYIGDKELCRERFNSYYSFSENVEVCREILRLFSINEEKGHIINGHVPVKIKDGESPVKADGKLFVIDGGISKVYQQATGIAGYTLIYDSHNLSLAEHKPFDKENSGEAPVIRIVEKLPSRANIADTDKGVELSEQISDLYALLDAYRNGTVKERG